MLTEVLSQNSDATGRPQEQSEKFRLFKKKNAKESVKLPEESHTPNRIYAIFNKNGNDVQAIAKYGPDGKKLWEIHTNDHHGIKPHYHPWQDGHPVRTLNKKGKYENEGRPLDESKAKTLHKV